MHRAIVGLSPPDSTSTVISRSARFARFSRLFRRLSFFLFPFLVDLSLATVFNFSSSRWHRSPLPFSPPTFSSGFFQSYLVILSDAPLPPSLPVLFSSNPTDLDFLLKSSCNTTCCVFFSRPRASCENTLSNATPLLYLPCLLYTDTFVLPRDSFFLQLFPPFQTIVELSIAAISLTFLFEKFRGYFLPLCSFAFLISCFLRIVICIYAPYLGPYALCFFILPLLCSSIFFLANPTVLSDKGPLSLLSVLYILPLSRNEDFLSFTTVHFEVLIFIYPCSPL